MPPTQNTARTLMNSASAPAAAAPSGIEPQLLNRLTPLYLPIISSGTTARAAVLQHTAEPVSTSGLVGATGMPLGTVGHHLQVLLEAGMLHRRRSGREVFYWWTDTARALVAGSTST
ncbi:helix-turn-helix domain-containing protein [Micromonospora peucetia]|uniref:ArsR/SmtB family transcription factor n=1 Tax=Micromonospora peucetia TaxID=47871 RepID=UPI002256D080|nr:helix-turn-helix domain-containing protein [Micromonospora peucetia]MCX4385751.1 helix-turn-helix domain-containing protein [Micromonospora peucetia]